MFLYVVKIFLKAGNRLKETSCIYFSYCYILVLYYCSITTWENFKCKPFFFPRSYNKQKFTSSLLTTVNPLWMKLTLSRDYIKVSQLRVLLMNNSVCFKVLLVVITLLNAAHIVAKHNDYYSNFHLKISPVNEKLTLLRSKIRPRKRRIGHHIYLDRK